MSNITIDFRHSMLGMMKLRKLFSVIGCALLLLTPQLPVHATSVSPTLPVTTNWTTSGLNEVLRVSGRLVISSDGLGTDASGGTISVEKPSSGAKVVGAYLVVANNWGQTQANTGVTIAGSTVSFTHKASAGSSTNYLADVTSILKAQIDAAPAGVIDLPVSEGAQHALIDGTALTVIFDDPNTAWGSLIFLFGTANPAGDSLTVSFPALGANELTGHTMSLGISFSCQPTSLGQSSWISVTTSSNSTPEFITKSAGGSDENGCVDGKLITVGGIGDSAMNPNPGASTTFVSAERTDDELYGISDYLAVGDTSITLDTVNPSSDDNIFQALFYFSRVQVANATVVDDPTVTQQVGAPNVNNISNPTPPSSEPAVYDGPIVTSTQKTILDRTGTILIKGSKLDQVKSVTLDGLEVDFQLDASGGMNLTLPFGVKNGVHDLILQGDFGKLTVQELLNIKLERATQVSKSAWTKLSGDGTKVTMVYRNPVEKGLVEFKVNGKTKASIQTTDLLDPKLSLVEVEGSRTSYFKESYSLVNKVKNVFEIYVDGVRVWRAAYKG